MIQMTDDMRRWLELAPNDGVPCLVATSTKDGHPQVSPKGSLAVFDEKTLCFWERSFRSSYDAIAENPHVAVYFRNPERTEIPYRGHALRFHGDARLVTEGPEWERAWSLANSDEQARDPERKGVAVLIDVERIEDLTGKVIMER